MQIIRESTPTRVDNFAMLSKARAEADATNSTASSDSCLLDFPPASSPYAPVGIGQSPFCSRVIVTVRAAERRTGIALHGLSEFTLHGVPTFTLRSLPYCIPPLVVV
jgi:hypothetical protein